MKRLLSRVILAALLISLPLTVAMTCSRTQQMITYNTLYSVEHSVVAANDGYQALVIKGSLPTNDLPKVSARFNQFQAGFLVALDLAQYNTNALAPAALQVEAQDFINLVSSIKNNGGVK